jgi:butyryl-CoA dehydrogenase
VHIFSASTESYLKIITKKEKYGIIGWSVEEPVALFMRIARQVKISAKFGYRFWQSQHAKLRMVDNFLPDPARKFMRGDSGRPGDESERGVFMNFKLSEEQELIKASAREFVLEHLEPVANEIDQNSRHPAEIFEKLGELGMMGISYSPEYGGGGEAFLTSMLVTEELGRACATTSFLHSYSYGLVGHPISTFGNEEQKKKYMPGIAAGKIWGAFSLTEPGAGTDVASATTTAVKDGDTYVLNGAKTFITNAIFADVFLVFCYTDKAAGAKGMSGFLIPKGTPGLVLGQHFEKMGVRGSQTSEVLFKDCAVPAEWMLGKEGQWHRKRR